MYVWRWYWNGYYDYLMKTEPPIGFWTKDFNRAAIFPSKEEALVWLEPFDQANDWSKMYLDGDRTKNHHSLVWIHPDNFKECI